MRAPIPVLIIAGFLGAGKTTVLNHMLRHHRGTRIGVVVNDFGSINIDALLVAGQVDAMVSLENGCVCCAVDVTELDELFHRLTEPRAGIDVLVVEASGLAEPRNLIRMVAGSDNPRIRFGGMIQVVDAELFGQQCGQHPELLDQLRLADLVVLNKVDRIPRGDLAAVRREITEIIDPAPLYATSQGVINPGLLFDAVTVAAPRAGEQLSFDALLASCAAEAEHRHLHDDYTTVSWSSDIGVHPRRFVELIAAPPAGVFRAKGFVRFAVAGDTSEFEVHLVGRQLIMSPSRRGATGSAATQLVFIGTGIDPELLVKQLAATEYSQQSLDPVELLPVWHYVPH